VDPHGSGRLKHLAEVVGPIGPRELEIVTTFRLRAPTPETEDSAERVARELAQLEEARVDLCVLAITPTWPETLLLGRRGGGAVCEVMVDKTHRPRSS
jgi:hypothetical protein